MQKSKSARRCNLLQVAAVGQPHAETLLANQGMRKVDGIGNRIGFRRIYRNKLVALAQLDLAQDPEILARLALFSDACLLNHFDKRPGAAVEDRQFKIVELDDRIVDAGPN